MKTINLLNSEKIKKQEKYKLDDIRVGNLVEIELNKGYRKSLKTCSDHITIRRLDPSKTGRIIGELTYYGFLGRQENEEIEVLFDINIISKIYQKKQKEIKTFAIHEK